MKTTKLFIFTGAQEPMIRIVDLDSSLRLDAFGMDRGYIQRCIISYNFAAQEKLLAGRHHLRHIDLGADLYFLGVVLLELCATQHPIHPLQTRGMEEMQDARPTPLVPWNTRLAIPGDLQEVLDMCMAYESAKRGTAETLSPHKSLARGRDFVLQRLTNRSKYETTLQELEGFRAQLYSSAAQPPPPRQPTARNQAASGRWRVDTHMEIASIQIEPMVEEVTLVDCSEVVNVKFEQLDYSLHNPSLPSPGAFNMAARLSGAPNTRRSHPQVFPHPLPMNFYLYSYVIC